MKYPISEMKKGEQKREEEQGRNNEGLRFRNKASYLVGAGNTKSESGRLAVH
jgi:hypothetical protein